jgi:hypothetical protein
LEALEAAGSGSNLGFNYSHLQKQVAAGQLGLTGGAQPIFVFFQSTKNKYIQLVLEAQQHKKYVQTTPLDDGVSSLFHIKLWVFRECLVGWSKFNF